MRKTHEENAQRITTLPKAIAKKNKIPERAEYSFVFKARKSAHSRPCNGSQNAEHGRIVK